MNRIKKRPFELIALLLITFATVLTAPAIAPANLSVDSKYRVFLCQ